jgi:hypothetical protein
MLLEEAVAPDAVRAPQQAERPIRGVIEQAIGDTVVVPRDVALGQPSLRQNETLRARNVDAADRLAAALGFYFRLSAHVLRLPFCAEALVVTVPYAAFAGWSADPIRLPRIAGAHHGQSDRRLFGEFIGCYNGVGMVEPVCEISNASTNFTSLNVFFASILMASTSSLSSKM